MSQECAVAVTVPLRFGSSCCCEMLAAVSLLFPLRAWLSILCQPLLLSLLSLLLLLMPPGVPLPDAVVMEVLDASSCCVGVTAPAAPSQHSQSTVPSPASLPNTADEDDVFSTIAAHATATTAERTAAALSKLCARLQVGLLSAALVCSEK